LTPMLKRLETLGYVKRARDTADERQVCISLADSGRKLRTRAFGSCALRSHCHEFAGPQDEGAIGRSECVASGTRRLCLRLKYAPRLRCAWCDVMMASRLLLAIDQRVGSVTRAPGAMLLDLPLPVPVSFQKRTSWLIRRTACRRKFRMIEVHANLHEHAA
jgi:hypothetical protein